MLPLEKYRGSTFAKSKWFTLGWTLQELIAPRKVKFFDSTWRRSGSKESLKDRINDITRIPTDILDGSVQVQTYPIACRMSWAANRETTRIEDMAYCLLGLFDIHIPLIYGEEQRAFTRLQEEICRNTTDMSLFAWKTKQPGDMYSGLLATSPTNFRESTNVNANSTVMQSDFSDEIAVTNRGIRFDNVTLARSEKYGVLLDLHCYEAHDGEWSGDLFVSLRKTSDGWVRYKSNETFCFDYPTDDVLTSLHYQHIFIRRTTEPGSLRSSDLYSHSILFDFSANVTLESAEPSRFWDPYMQGFLPMRGFCGTIHISTRLDGCEREDFLILCGISEKPEVNLNSLGWVNGYSFKALSRKDKHFGQIQELITGRELHNRMGFFITRGHLEHYVPEGSWNETESCFLQDSAVGIRHKLLVQPSVVSEREDGCSWDVLKLSIRCEKLEPVN